MLRKKDPPKVLFDDNGTFVDASTDMLNFQGDTLSLPLVAADDKLYFGRVKPFSSIYVEMGTANTNAATMTVKYYDEATSAFAEVTDLVDETKGFTRSGFIHFENPARDTSSVTWAQNAVNSITQNWVEITFDADLSASTAVKGMNIVFSSDEDWKRIYPNVLNYLPSTETSGINYHEQARIDIVNRMRRDGKYKIQLGTTNNDGLAAQIDEWDFLDIDEINLWSAYQSLEYFFDSIAQTPDDLFSSLSAKFSKKAGEARQVYYLSLDRDDDGVEDIQEKLGTQHMTGTIVRQ